jgi:hypothetical protein
LSNDPIAALKLRQLKVSTPGKMVMRSAKDGAVYGGLAGFGHTDSDISYRVVGLAEGMDVGALIRGAASGMLAGAPAARDFMAWRVGKPAP